MRYYVTMDCGGRKSAWTTTVSVDRGKINKRSLEQAALKKARAEFGRRAVSGWKLSEAEPLSP